MYICYFDETGDDGYPQYSSKLFVLTSLYMHHQNWKAIYEKLLAFRRFAKERWNIPIKMELHTKAFLLGKNPFRSMGISEQQRLEFCRSFAKFLATLDIDVINVSINKLKINSQNIRRYKDVLDVALSFNIQRIENSIRRIEPATKFLVITDEGRVGKMQKTTRKIQKINFIPSMFASETYRSEIKMMIEDPLPKNSKESFFIQVCDFISYFAYLYILKRDAINDWHGRLSWLSQDDVKNILDILKPILNLSASRTDEHGLVIYPK